VWKKDSEARKIGVGGEKWEVGTLQSLASVDSEWTPSTNVGTSARNINCQCLLIYLHSSCDFCVVLFFPISIAIFQRKNFHG